MKKTYTLFTTILLSSYLFGANQTVINTNDAGAGSLRNAISLVTSGDTIFFDPSLAGSTITLTSQILISTDVVIQGFSTGNTVTISGDDLVRIFSIASSTNVYINRIELRDGYLLLNSGAAIYNLGSLELNYCRLYSNWVITSSSLAGGGAIYNNGVLILRNCELFDNLARTSFARTNGGAILNEGPILEIYSCSFYNNKVHNISVSMTSSRFAYGGAIYNNIGKTTINSSTFSNNVSEALSAVSAGRGGAIFNRDSLIITNSTIANNVASGSVIGDGAGIWSDGELILYNTIIADNKQSGIIDDDLFTNTTGTSISLGNNIIEDTTSFGLTFISGDIVADPLLDTLIYNSGAFTKTLALLCGSPAFNAGNNTNSPTLDQINQVRIFDGTIDIGAFEAQGSLLPTVVASAQDTIICTGDTTTISATLSNTGTYSWDNGLGVGQAQNIYPTNNTTYIVIGTDAITGCVDTTSIAITVNPLPTTPVISLSSSNLTTGTYTSYQWYLNGNVLTADTTQAITPTQNGDYTVEVTDGNGCSSISTLYNVTTVSLKELAGLKIQIYPNPTENVLYLNNNEFRLLTIFNSVGKQVRTIKMDKGNNQLDVSELPQGFYLLQFVGENQEKYTTSFIKK